jgi:hypothetical protein
LETVEKDVAGILLLTSRPGAACAPPSPLSERFGTSSAHADSPRPPSRPDHEPDLKPLRQTGQSRRDLGSCGRSSRVSTPTRDTLVHLTPVCARVMSFHGDGGPAQQRVEFGAGARRAIHELMTEHTRTVPVTAIDLLARI